MDEAAILARLDKLQAFVWAGGDPAPPPAVNEISVVFPFDFTLSSPHVLRAIPAGGSLNRVALLVTTPFAGGAPEIMLGTALSPALLLDLTLPALGIADQYDSGALVKIDVADNLLLTLSPGLIAGAGILLYQGLLT